MILSAAGRDSNMNVIPCAMQHRQVMLRRHGIA
jgi:hypothetical protein